MSVQFELMMTKFIIENMVDGRVSNWAGIQKKESKKNE